MDSEAHHRGERQHTRHNVASLGKALVHTQARRQAILCTRIMATSKTPRPTASAMRRQRSPSCTGKRPRSIRLRVLGAQPMWPCALLELRWAGGRVALGRRRVIAVC
ncbi:hypothetical protein PUNSTDRAFT_53019 [Punctularia strigosozonata HHB-11173 SS5]|uniref:uncharacterized protein n=1 Tax=Punctularia strigosozonata (strain HHB-11173) TaxID=741275 RepID=UPI0004417EBD|nr:uncharacterized protein PUNSTDRAFT_53019 [Punctularia strigosozonata HHB-11173 SS5]EIN07579.1 hypothetical protein PUNSTDRAFT_53019 [Punctularia strigosozonata HHB-11173 SS5]